jgi:hypothetical protein
VVSVPEQVVHSIRVHLSGDQITPEQRFSGVRIAFNKIRDLIGMKPVVCVSGMVSDHIGEMLADDCRGVIFMDVGLAVILLWEKLFASV